MKVRFDGVVRTGHAIDVCGVDSHEMAAAVRTPEDGRVSAAPPGPVHDHVGHVHPTMELRLPAALATTARALGERAPQDGALAETREALAAETTVTADLTALRRRVADASADESALSERVARLGGRVEARRRLGAETDEAEAQLYEAVQRLSEAETERLAAEQTLAEERSRARRLRDGEERQLRLVDRERNLSRAARTYLAERVYPAFAEALGAVPGDADPGDGPGQYEGGPTTAALAVARLAPIEAPVVLACDRFDSAASARACLDVSVLRIEV